ncbi:nck associated protein 1 Hem isoform X2 [Brevipalpus obovatus]|uniref:nck associated protein 1 Hem isoform X2 n=1 Tax=Brevipalpus obovatus TaxID=246614 RepID=UPI003D9DEA91
MVRHLSVSQQKIAEKLTILNDRGIGMLTRLYNIKKQSSDPKSRPSILSDKSLESAMKQIVRRFPHPDTRSNNSLIGAVTTSKNDIMKATTHFYYTFVDILEFKDHVGELLTTMDACQLRMDIVINVDLTRSYLDLITTYASLMILVSRVEDRKAVIGLFNTAHELTHGHSESSFPRLGQMIVDYENPMKKLSEEFVPHAKLLYNALVSLQGAFHMRNLGAEEWRKSQILSIVANPNKILTPAQTEPINSEYISVDTMERYVIYGFMMIHQHLNQPAAHELFSKALQCGWVMTLFRDEVIHTHNFVQQFFETIKSKRVSDVKDAYNHVLQFAGKIHREKRKFLRSTLKELAFILADQPGLLGPKALLVFMALSFARDEVNWLLRHCENNPARQTRPKTQVEDLVDRQLPELLFHIEELRSLVRKYGQVIQRYYIEYLTNYDAVALNHAMQNVSMMPEEDSVILESIYQTIANLSIKQVEAKEIFDFRGLRLDWFRLQAYSSVSRYPMNLFDHKDLALLMNLIVFHVKMVDYLDDMLTETSDLSLFCFYHKIFDDQFHMCLEFPAQTRYIISFPMICSHFLNACHELAPEERTRIGERSISTVNLFLDEMSKEAKNIITMICDRQCIFNDQLLPKHVAPQIASVVKLKKRDKKNKMEREFGKPGSESYRRTREDMTEMDKLHMALTELCFAINYCPAIHVWDHTLAPRAYLYNNLESRFNKALVGMIMYNSETNEIAKPSELLSSVKAYMNVLLSIENYVQIEVTNIFNTVLLQQTQPQDSHGDKTITSLYSNWYLEVLLRRVSAGQICYSPLQKAFVTLPVEGSVPFVAEEYSDVNELRALAELVGPYGMRYCSENLMWHIASQVTELRKIVIANKEVLLALRSNFDKPDQMRDLFKKLQGVDNALLRMKIIGEILCFRELAQEALADVLVNRIPFLMSSIQDFAHLVPSNDDILIGNQKLQVKSSVTEMCSAAGLSNKVDPALIAALLATKNELGEDEYQIACLLMVLIAVSLPKLARSDQSYFKPSLEAHANNIHCLAHAINKIAGALFTICNHGDTIERLKEFLALASSSLLRLGQEQDKEMVKNRESVYILLDLIVKESPFLTMDLMESCFPYALLRNAYHAVYKNDGVVTANP